MHPKRNCPIQALGGTLDYAYRREPRPGALLRWPFRDPRSLFLRSFLRGVCVLHALLGSSTRGRIRPTQVRPFDRGSLKGPIHLLRHFGGSSNHRGDELPPTRFTSRCGSCGALPPVSVPTDVGVDRMTAHCRLTRRSPSPRGTARRHEAGDKEMATSSLHPPMECRDALAERLEPVPLRPGPE